MIKQIGLNKTKLSKGSNCYYLCYGGFGNIQKIYHYLYDNATLYLDRKYKKFKNWQ